MVPSKVLRCSNASYFSSFVFVSSQETIVPWNTSVKPEGFKAQATRARYSPIHKNLQVDNPSNCKLCARCLLSKKAFYSVTGDHEELVSRDYGVFV